MFFSLALAQAQPAVVKLFPEPAPAAASTRGFNDRARAMVAAFSRLATVEAAPALHLGAAMLR